MATVLATIMTFSLHVGYPPCFMLSKFYLSRLKSVKEKWGQKQIIRYAHHDFNHWKNPVMKT